MLSCGIRVKLSCCMGGTPVKQTPENRNTTRTSVVSTSGPSYMVVVGGARRGSKAKKPVLSRYLRPKTPSCHDSCKYATKDEGSDIKRPMRRGSRKMQFNKNKGVKRTDEPVERKKITKTKPNRSPEPKIRAPVEPIEAIRRERLLSSKKVGVSKQVSSTNRKATQKDPKMPKNRPTNLKTKAISTSALNASSRLNGQKNKKDNKTNKQTRTVPKSTSVSPVMDQNPKKVQEITEMTLQEADTAEYELVTPIVEIIQSPTTVTTESVDLLIAENTRSSSEKQVSDSESEHENADDEQVLEEDCENASNEEVIVYEEDEGLEVKFRRGRFIEPESDDNSPRKLKFRRGTVLDNNCNHESESVNLKHQEQKEKEAQELLNRLIEEKASKLAEDRKTKVGALVGAFETVISLHDDTPSSES